MSTASSSARMRRLAPWFARRRSALILLLLALALGLPILNNPFALDDLLLREQLESGGVGDLYRFVDPARTSVRRAAGELPWWTADALQVEFFRPLTALLFALEQRLWPGLAWLWHLHSLAWYALAVGLVFAVYRRAARREHDELVWSAAATAGLAAVLWAVDDAHATAVGWIAARHGVIAASLGLAGFLAHLRWREESWRPGAILGPLGLGLALLASESGLAMVGYVLAHAIVRERGSIGERARVVTPYLGVVAIWAALYLSLGYGAHACGMYLDLLGDPLGSLARLPAHVALIFAAVLGPPMIVELAAFGSSGAYWALALVAGLGCVALVAILRPLLRRCELARMWGLGAVLAAVPTALALPADRHLFAVGVGAMGLIAAVLAEHLERRVAHGPLFAILAWIWFALHLVLAPLGFVARGPGVAVIQAEIDEATAVLAATPEAEDARPRVLVNAPSELLAIYAPATSTALGRDRLALHLLHAGQSAVELRRLDARTLELRGAWLSAPAERNHRAASAPMAIGEHVDLGSFTIAITKADPRGRPLAIQLRSEVALEELELAWFAWIDGRPEPLTLPRSGAELSLGPAAWTFSTAVDNHKVQR